MSEESRTSERSFGGMTRWEWADAFACYYLTSAIAFLGVLVGFSLLQPGRSIPYGEFSFVKRCAAWDGGQFMQIMEHGYQYDPKKISNVALFPALPVLALGVVSLTGWSSASALLLISNVFLCLSFFVFYRYVRERFPQQSSLANWTLLAFGLFPISFFFRMAYSESVFLFLSLMVLYGFERGWPLPLVALLIGAATAGRLLGVALVVPLLMQIMRRERQTVDRLALMSLALPLSVWGLLAYMFFLWQRFDDPLVFARAQENFLLRPQIDVPARLLALATGEPIWGNYLSTSNAYWRRYSPEPSAWLNLQFANPIYFLMAVFMLIAGRWKRILNNEEAVLTGLLLLIPYLTRGYEFCMGSQARYSAAAFPLFMVWGALLSRLPILISGSLLAFWGFLLAIYSALFAAWYFVL